MIETQKNLVNTSVLDSSENFFSYESLTSNPQIQMGVFLKFYKQDKIDATTLGMLIASIEEAK